MTSISGKDRRAALKSCLSINGASGNRALSLAITAAEDSACRDELAHAPLD